eukprot:TRINITY_DN121875_c0_g1_i1.p1 TRINITY_DN121875_c0_g1~~TRINITY_DN121875_c0_g1_i1.p1  ORF type:complete len:687 (-),score=173.68 TRINITY_DN121875_c0_g1_i1:52-2112(-)
MDSWFQAAVKEASKLGDQVQKHTESLQKSVDLAIGGGDLDVVFEEGPLGFTLDGLKVAYVEPDGQADRQGLVVGCEILQVEGFPVPKKKPDKEGEDQRVARTVRKWIKEMPRPGTLSFKRPPGEKEEGTGSDKRAASKGDADTSAGAAAALAGRGGGGGAEAATGGATADAAGPPEPSEEEADRVLELLAAVPERPRLPLGELGSATSRSGFGPGRQEAANRTPSPSPAPSPGPELAVEKPGSPSPDRSMRADVERLQSELRQWQQKAILLEHELDASKADCEDLRHQLNHAQCEGLDAPGTAHSNQEVRLRSLQDQLNSSRSENDASRRKISELQAQLTSTTEQCQRLQNRAARSEEDLLEAFGDRESLMEEEVVRLRSELSQLKVATQERLREADEQAKDTEAKLSNLRDEASERSRECRQAQARARSAEEQAAVAGREIRRLTSAHTAELQQTEDRYEQMLRDLRQTLLGQEERVADLRRKNGELEGRLEAAGGGDGRQASRGQDDSDSDAEPAERSSKVEAGPDISLGNDQRTNEEGVATRGAPKFDDAERSALQEQIASLENRCCALQKKLNSRPIVYTRPSQQAPQAQFQPPPWDAWLRSTAGSRVADLALITYEMPEKALRKLTERLLGRRAWLWVFYMHILLLYTIAASWMAQATPQDPAAAMEKTFHEGGAVSLRGR